MKKSFSWALEKLKEGKKVCRKGWNGKDMWVWMCDVDDIWIDDKGDAYKRLPYLYMKTADNSVVPWLASNTDILANDWSVYV